MAISLFCPVSFSGGGWDDPFDEHPPPGPEGEPFFDWPAFERELHAYAGDRERETAATDG